MTYPVTPKETWLARAQGAFRAVVGSAADLWPNLYGVTARVLATMAVDLDLRLKRLHDRHFVHLADAAAVERHAFDWGLTRRAATRATGNATFTAAGAGTVPLGLAFQRATDGALFTSSAAVTVAGAGSVTVPLIADIAGTSGNTAAGVGMTLLSPLPAVLASPTGVVAAGGLGGAADAESIEDLRARVLFRKRNPPQGGNATDWIGWVRAVPGVDKVFVDSFVNSTRRVWIAFTFAGRANGIPTSGDVDAVVAAVDNINVRPVTAQVTVVAPTAVPIDITATGVEPLTVATEAAIRAELAAMFQDRLGVATPNRNYVLSRSWISEAIARAVGEDRHVLTVPSADVVLSTAGQMPVLGTVTLS